MQSNVIFIFFSTTFNRKNFFEIYNNNLKTYENTRKKVEIVVHASMTKDVFLRK